MLGLLIVPFVSILTARKYLGKAVNIENKALRFLSGKFEGLTALISGDANKSKKDFCERVIDDVFNPYSQKDQIECSQIAFDKKNKPTVTGSVEKSSKEVIEEIKGKILKLNELRGKYGEFGFIKRFFNKEAKDTKKTMERLEKEISQAVIDLNNHYGFHAQS